MITHVNLIKSEIILKFFVEQRVFIDLTIYSKWPQLQNWPHATETQSLRSNSHSIQIQFRNHRPFYAYADL